VLSQADTIAGSLVPEALLIDDNGIQLRIRETVLRGSGMSVACASSAEEALVISGMTETEEEYRGLNGTFLRKPCPPESLIHQVQTCLRSAS
jgi:hypothetical protein